MDDPRQIGYYLQQETWQVISLLVKEDQSKGLGATWQRRQLSAMLTAATHAKDVEDA